MPKIDTARIEGFEEMTPEAKLEALLGYEYEDHAEEWQKAKSALSKANSEAAEWKKKHNALLSEEEQAKQAAEEELKQLRNDLAEMKQRETIASFTAKYTALGYDADLAQETAEALAKGDTDKMFANHLKFNTAHDKAYKAQLMSEGSNPPAGKGSETMTLEALRKLPLDKQLAFEREHPEEYKQLYGGNE